MSDADSDSDSGDGGHGDGEESMEIGEEETSRNEEILKATNREEEILKALSTQNQLRIWDALLEVRIHFQKVLLEANRLPQKEVFEKVLKAQEHDDDNGRVTVKEKASANAQSFLDNLERLREVMTIRFPEASDFASFRDETIQKWNDKTQLSFGKIKNSAGPSIPTLKQISHILADRSRLKRRTQVKRTSYTVIGKRLKMESNEGGDGGVQDEEIFDDDDFYHQLLKELIDRKTSNVNDPAQLSRHWLSLQKLRTKLKRNVDTKASKGRKTRYDVHPKLENFMAPNDTCTMSEPAVKELMNSLFGNSSRTS